MNPLITIRHERNTKMKPNKTDTKKHQTALVSLILKMKRLDAEKRLHAAALEEDFVAHEDDYRSGIKTPAGILSRKPRWIFDANPAEEP